MKYRVVFRERNDVEGEQADDPAGFLDAQLDEDTVLDARLVGRLQPEAMHSSDSMEEDDAYLSITAEIWEYDVADGKDQDFKDAMQNSGVVMEFEALESGEEPAVS